MEIRTENTHQSRTVTGLEYRLLELRMLAEMALVSYRSYPKLGDAWRALTRHIKLHLDYQRITHLRKAVKVGRQTFVQFTFPKFGTRAMRTLLRNELSAHVPIPNHTRGLNILLLAITKKCSLRCAHCFEWDNLNQKEQLSVGDVVQIIQKFQDRGVASIELSGGEPLNRFNDLIQILRQSKTDQSDFWLLSSGYRLTESRAEALASEGLTGVCISLDHWDAEKHDAFRGLEGSFDWAMQAAKNARAAGMAVCFALTAIKSFCNEKDLFRYAKLAKEQRVHFIRLLEPQAVGHYAGQPVLLEEPHLKILEAFNRILNTDPAYTDFPLVDYYSAYQRRIGCSGAGSRFMYVDTDGDYHACPFCQNKCGSALCDSIDTGNEKMQKASGCHAYETV